MSTVPTKRVTPTEGQPEACPDAEVPPNSDAAATDALTPENIRELRSFFLLLDAWDRELHKQ